jgi:molybdate transport system substrate-binding protein
VSLRIAVLALTAVLAAAATPVGADAPELTLSVAISMKDAMQALGRRFTDAHPGVTLRYNVGSSGELQKQIEAGAPVDVFVSAAARQMDELERRGLLKPGSRRVFARNVLVVVTPADARVRLDAAADLLGPGVTRVVVGNPRTVPAGQYSEQSLRALGLWDRLRERLVFAENVRQALEYVARGEVDAGFVYATDVAVRPDRVREAFRPAEDTYGPVVYPAAVVKASRHPRLAAAFVELLVSGEGQARLRSRGFLPPPGGR